MTAPSISLQLQHKSVGKQRILGAMNIEIAAQQVVALRGPSGAGKSSLLAILSTLDSQFDGALHLLGNDMTRTSESKRARFRAQHMGFVFQVPRLIAGFDGAANLRITDTMCGRKHDQAWALQLAERVGLSAVLKQRVDTMSGGERQRLTLARALLGRPQLLFADEPTGNLDPQSASAVLDLLVMGAREFGLTCVVATHDPLVIERADRVIALQRGALC